MSVIVGLDISLNSPGWCRIDTENGAHTFDTLDFSALKDLERIDAAVRALADLCRPADLVVMEGLSMGLPMNQAGRSFVPQGRQDLVGLTYILRLWLWKQQKPALLVSPMSLKKFATGDHRAKKDMMLREVMRRWNVLAADDNQADAVALAEVGRAYLFPDSVELAKFQKEVLKKVSTLADGPVPKKTRAKRQNA